MHVSDDLRLAQQQLSNVSKRQKHQEHTGNSGSAFSLPVAALVVARCLLNSSSSNARMKRVRKRRPRFLLLFPSPQKTISRTLHGSFLLCNPTVTISITSLLSFRFRSFTDAIDPLVSRYILENNKSNKTFDFYRPCTVDDAIM